MSTSRRSLNEIEADLDHNRKRMGATLDALQHRLSAEDLFERSIHYLRSSGSEEFIANLRYSVTQNPVPLSLVSVGLVWLIASGSNSARQAVAEHTPDGDSSRMKDKVSGASRRTQSAARGVRDGAGKVATSSREGLHHVSSGARRGASSLGKATQHSTRRVVDGVDYMRREQPLVTAALGLAVGAASAASLPRTASEDQTMGETRDGFLDTARETGEEKIDQARSVAGSAAQAAGDAAKSEADRQGLRHSE